MGNVCLFLNLVEPYFWINFNKSKIPNKRLGFIFPNDFKELAKLANYFFKKFVLNLKFKLN